MGENIFDDAAIVACGTLAPELNQLKKEGFLGSAAIIYTTPGLHQDCVELESQLISAVERARRQSSKIIVVYGGKYCYVNVNEPTRTMGKIIAEMGPDVERIEATHCMDMIADEPTRDELAQGEKVWWMTPGWFKYWDKVFKGWDKSIANENFPRHTGGARVLDGLGMCEKYLNEEPEVILERSDWMGIPLQGVPVTLDRFKNLLSEAKARLDSRAQA